MSRETVKLALAQISISDSMEENLQKAVRSIQEASNRGASLILFPEVQLSPFFPQYKGRSAECYLVSFESPYLERICSACRENSIFASPNFFVRTENGKTYDMSFLISDQGEILGTQKMVHIAQAEQFYEQDYYTPSEEGFQVFDTILGKIGIVVCFDRHYPESIRTEALRGAELILIPTANTKAEPSELFRWEIRVQAFQNCVNVAMCNRVGLEDEMDFSGESLVTDYNGECIALAGDKETLLLADVNLKAASAARARKPYLSLRRTELYE